MTKMKLALLPFALLIASAAAQAHEDHGRAHVGCNIHSDYNIGPYRNAYLFQRDDGPARSIGIGGGRLFIDGKEIQLSAGDQRRVAQFEQELHGLGPEVQKVSEEAVAIAFTALVEVARGLSSDPDETIANLEKSRRQTLAEIRNKPMTVFNDDAMEDIVEPIVTRFIPDVAGGAVTAGLHAAFAGEAERQKFQQRMDRMEHELDTRVDARAKALEPLALAMCDRLTRMDALDDALEYRLPGGESLQLLEISDHRHKD
jgi:hypothetical protein